MNTRGSNGSSREDVATQPHAANGGPPNPGKYITFFSYSNLF